ncbi:3971_t:CDS:2, partial [Gigaspora margarita]
NCDKLSCNICRPPRFPLKDFEQLHCLLDLVPGNNLHYKSFEKLYGMRMIENHRLSLINSNKKTKPKHTMPFCPAAACAKNIGITVNCIECDKPHLLFNAKKLSEKDHTLLQSTYDLSMTILLEQLDIYNELESNSDSDIEVNEQENNEDNSDKEDIKVSNNYAKESISELFSRVLVNNLLSCASKIKKPYYLAKIYPNVCINCGYLK